MAPGGRTATTLDSFCGSDFRGRGWEAVQIVDADFRGRGELLIDHIHDGIGLDEVSLTRPRYAETQPAPHPGFLAPSSINPA